MYRYVLLLHLLGATVWTGGHIYLIVRVFPAALRNRSARQLLDFEQSFERLGFTALATQIATGIWLASQLLRPSLWFSFEGVASQMIATKLLLLGVTALTAIDARFRVLPQMNDERVATMLPHITIVTLGGILFVAAGVGIRTGGWF